jgi:hypothetical protein
VLPRIGGTHGDLAQSLAIAVLEHDRNMTGLVRARFGRPSGVLPPQGSLVGSDADHIAAIFNLPPGNIFDATRGPARWGTSWSTRRGAR